MLSRGGGLGNYHQKRVRVNYQYFVVMDNRPLPSMEWLVVEVWEGGLGGRFGSLI